MAHLHSLRIGDQGFSARSYFTWLAILVASTAACVAAMAAGGVWPMYAVALAIGGGLVIAPPRKPAAREVAQAPEATHRSGLPPERRLFVDIPSHVLRGAPLLLVGLCALIIPMVGWLSMDDFGLGVQQFAIIYVPLLMPGFIASVQSTYVSPAMRHLPVRRRAFMLANGVTACLGLLLGVIFLLLLAQPWMLDTAHLVALSRACGPRAIGLLGLALLTLACCAAWVGLLPGHALRGRALRIGMNLAHSTGLIMALYGVFSLPLKGLLVVGNSAAWHPDAVEAVIGQFVASGEPLLLAGAALMLASGALSAALAWRGLRELA